MSTTVKKYSMSYTVSGTVKLTSWRTSSGGTRTETVSFSDSGSFGSSKTFSLYNSRALFNTVTPQYAYAYSSSPQVKICSTKTSSTTPSALYDSAGITCYVTPSSDGYSGTASISVTSGSISYTLESTEVTYSHKISVGTGGSGTTVTKSVKFTDGSFTSGEDATITATANSGYHFTGFTGNTSYATISGNTCTIPKNVASDVYITANFAKDVKYTVRFYDGIGSGKGSQIGEAQSVLAGTDAVAPQDPTRSGCTFGGWSPSYTNITGDTDCAAQWKCTVTWNANGGTGGRTDSNKAYGSTVTAPTPSRTGYSFAGWFTAASGGTQLAGSTLTVSGTATYYAHWTANTYYVKFNANGGTGSMSNETFTYGTQKALTSNGFSKTDHAFAGWSTTSSGAVAYTNGQSVSNLSSTNGATVNLYAKWTQVEFTLQVNPNYTGASVDTKSIKLKTGTTRWCRIGVLSRKGGVLARYRDSQSNTFADSSGNCVGGTYWTADYPNGTFKGSQTDPLVIYAAWNPTKYALTRVKRLSDTGQETTIGTETASYGSAYELPATTQTNYRFAGWRVASGLDATSGMWGSSEDSVTSSVSSSSVVMMNGASGSVYVRNLSSTDNATVKVVASFDRITHGVTLLSVRNNVNSAGAATDWPSDDGWDMSVLLDGSPVSGATEDVYVNASTKFKYDRIRFTGEAGRTYKVRLASKAAYRESDFLRVPMSIGGSAFTRVAGDVPTWEADVAVSAEGGDVEISVESNYVQASRVLPSEVSTSRFVAKFEMKAGTNRTVVATANDDIAGAVFSHWTVGEQSYYSKVHEFELTPDASFLPNITYSLGTVHVKACVDAKSAAAGCASGWVTVTNGNVQEADIQYKSKTVFNATVPSAYASTRRFSGWYSPQGVLVSPSSKYTTPEVTSDTTLYARFSAPVTISRELEQTPGSTVGALLHFDGDADGADASSLTGFKEIGSTFRFSVTPTGDGVFAGWYAVPRASNKTPLPYAASDSVETAGDLAIVCLVKDSSLENYVAVYNMANGSVDMSLGTITVIGENVESVSKSVYEEKTGKTAESESGLFYRVIFGTSFTISAAQAGTLPYSGATEKVGDGDERQIAKSVNTAPNVVAKGDAVYRIKWGEVSRVRVAIRYSKADGVVVGRGRPGYDCASFSSNESNDECRAYGTYESGSTMTLVAQAANGYRFVKWVREHENGESSSASFSSVTPVQYDMTQPVLRGTWTPFSNESAVWFRATFARESSVSLHKWEGGAANKTMKWKSKVYVLSKPANMTSVRVDARKYPVAQVSVDTFSSPDGARTNNGPVTFSGGDASGVAGQTMRRLPPRRPERYFQVEIQNDAEVDAVFLGTNAEGLDT